MPENVGFTINLESLIDLSARLNQTFDEDFILNSALLSLMGKLRILRACFLEPCNRINIKDGVSEMLKDPGCYFSIRQIKGKIPAIKVPAFIVRSFSELSMNAPGERILFDNGFRYAVPIIYQESLLGIICLGPRYDNKSISGDESKYIHLVSAITASALNSCESNRSLIEAKNNLEKRNQLLSSLLEISREFNTILSKSQIIKILSYRLMGQLMVSRYAIFLHDKNKKFEKIANRFDKTITADVLRELEKIGKATPVDQFPLSSHAASLLNQVDARLVAPMNHQGANKGILILGRKLSGEDFTPENYQFIEALGNIAISALENERLFIEEIEKKRLEEEMQLAMNIQKNLLPKEIPPVEGYDVSGLNIPSRLVGGDYYDIIPLPGNKLMIAIADVSGKGAPAALLMANVQAALRALAPMGLELPVLVSKLNHLVFINTTPDRFITLFLGVLDLSSDSFHYINAGHNPPLYYSNGEFQRLFEGGIILGVIENPVPYKQGLLNFEREGVLVLFTDGITEAPDNKDEEFGEEKLRSVIEAYGSSPAKILLDEVIKSVHNHSKGELQSDDITIITLKSVK